MHDSLDLAAIKQQIQESKARTEHTKRWTGYILSVFFISIVLSFGLTFLADTFGFRDIQLLNAMSVVLMVGLLINSLYPTYVAWRNLRQYSARIIAYAPSFVHRPSTLTVIWELRPFLWMCAVGIIVVIGHNYILINAPLIAIFFYMLPVIAYYLNNRLMFWINKGGPPRINAALKLLPFSHRLLYFLAAITYQNQDFAQTEAIMLKLLGTRTDYATPNVVLELIVLAECWWKQQRFSEVVPILEAAIKISPVASLSYVGLAEWYLDQEPDAERAVELMDIALANTAPKQAVLYAAQHAVIAQALSLTGRTIRAKASLEKATATVNTMPASTATEVHRRVGYAYKALGEIETARTHFNRAVELAPNDSYGDLARQALASLSATT